MIRQQESKRAAAPSAANPPIRHFSSVRFSPVIERLRESFWKTRRTCHEAL
jgi:hypothetical protein